MAFFKTPLSLAFGILFAATTCLWSQEDSETPQEDVAAAQEAPAESPSIAQPGGDPSKSPQFYFEFLEYRYDLHRRVLDRWQDLVRANRNALSPGTTTLKYYVNDQGFISVIENKTGGGKSTPATENARKLGSYVLALENKDPAPFPESVKRVYPKGYFYQISLAVR